MRLIDADALLRPISSYNPVKYTYEYGDVVTVQDVKSIPTIDAVEVVRCKDCINFTKGKDEWGSCFENPMKMWRETDFCSWGERRTDAD